MKHLLLLLLIFPLSGKGQLNERRGVFSIVGAVGTTTTAQQPRVTVVGGPYTLQAEKVENPECYDDNGRLIDCPGKNYHVNVGMLYRVFNQSRTKGWMVMTNVGIQQQSYSLNYPSNRRFSIPVACTPSITRLLRSTGVGVSVGRFWDVSSSLGNGFQVLARMGVMAAGHFRYERNGYAVRLPDRRAVSYLTSFNTGTIIQMYDQVPQYNWLLTPEVGLTGNNIPFELTASVHIPLTQGTVYSELHSFLENRRIVGQNRVDYSNAVFNLTARLRLDLPRKPRKIRPVPSPWPDAPKQPARHKESDLPPPPVHDNSRFGRIPIKEPIRLAVFFDLEKAELRRLSFTELDELAAWLQASPTVRIRLDGHTDLIGDAQDNMRLSRQRVEVVRDYLVNKGVAASRIEVKGYGETRPLNRNCPPPDYCPENRRVEMVILQR